MISKSEQLEQLFVKWEWEQENETDLSWELTRGGKNITKSHFRRDGIIDEAIFTKEKRKMLFISNEANDDEYSAKTNVKPNNVDDYRRYYETGYDDWLGKMRERTSALYKIVAGVGRMEMSDADATLHYAVMDLNKRGGGSDVKSASHIEEYCMYYQDFIKKEIEIINPDVVVWLGTKTYDMELHSKYLGAECEKDKRYFIIDYKKVPILRMWHTSYYQGHIEPLPGYSNRIVGKLCAKCLEELEKYNISVTVQNPRRVQSIFVQNREFKTPVLTRIAPQTWITCKCFPPLWITLSVAAIYGLKTHFDLFFEYVRQHMNPENRLLSTVILTTAPNL